MDTGAPSSFGSTSSLTFAGESFRLGTGFLGLEPASLSQFVDVPCVGLLGADLLGEFDHLFDVPTGRYSVSRQPLTHPGSAVELDELMGIPIVKAFIGDDHLRMFFDTGAQISYLQDDLLRDFPFAGTFTDFYPSVGRFQTDTYHVPASIAGVDFNLRCGSLPGILGNMLRAARAQGIIGNSVFENRTIGYFPRRRQLVL